MKKSMRFSMVSKSILGKQNKYEVYKEVYDPSDDDAPCITLNVYAKVMKEREDAFMDKIKIRIS